MYNYPYVRPGLLARLFGTTNFTWSGFLDGTQKTLGVINQAIPIVNQVKPMITNAKTVFRIADELKKTTTNATANTNYYQNTNKPVFYI